MCYFKNNQCHTVTPEIRFGCKFCRTRMTRLYFTKLSSLKCHEIANTRIFFFSGELLDASSFSFTSYFCIGEIISRTTKHRITIYIYMYIYLGNETRPVETYPRIHILSGLFIKTIRTSVYGFTRESIDLRSMVLSTRSNLG